MSTKTNIKDIAIEDLLCREPVSIDTEEIYKFIEGRRVMVTGGSGSIGSELVRQIAKFKPKEIILFDRNENNVFFIERELKNSYPDIKITPRLGSVSDKERVKTIFEETLPNLVYHAAANKHVPLSEANPSEAIHNNILGTHIIADAAAAIKCDAFVFISTDKAVNPTSVMGATKRIAELYIQLMAKHHSETRFVTVRFGNVLGSSGSVVPIFRAQIAAGGPVMVTHPDMCRFFMTIPEAAQLLLQASVQGLGGEIFVLDMGESVKIIDLARNMITLSGLKPDIDIKINFSGLRPGEKIFEELLFDYESTIITSHPKIRITKTPYPTDDVLNKILNLEQLDSDCSPDDLRKELGTLIPEAKLGGK